jgi:hypothetical protein
MLYPRTVIIIFLSFLVGFLYVIDRENDLGDPSAGMEIDLLERRSGYIHLVFIGHSRCPFSNGEDVFHAVSSIRDALIDYTRKTGTSVMTTGIASDRNPIAGINYLRDIDLFYFDQIIAGSGLHNEGLYRYGLSLNHSSGTPQLLILGAEVEIFPTAGGIESIQRSYEVIASASGLPGLQEVLHDVENGLLVGD